MKLLLCDDDISVIEVLKSQIDYKQLGVENIIEAYNGQMAMEIIDREKPDLILCDIGMPICDGIEVLKYIAEKKYDVEFSFLTCYEDFEYAKIAIQYGVTDYVTKPFEIQDVKICLQKMIANAVQKQQISSENISQAQKDSLTRSIFHQAINGVLGTDKNSVDISLRQNGAEFTADSLWHIVFSCYDMTDAIMNTWSRDLLCFTVSRLSNEALDEYVGSSYAIVESNERFMWTICFVPGEVSDEQLTNRCQTLINCSMECTSMNPVVLLSGKVPFWQSHDVVTLMYEKIRKVRYCGGQILTLNQDLDNIISDDEVLNSDHILWYLKKRDEAGYQEYVKVQIDRLSGSKDSLSTFRREITNIFLTIFQDNGVSSKEVLLDEQLAEYDKTATNNKNSLMEYCMYLMRMQQDVMKDEIDSKDIMARAIRYVDEHYRDNIDRDDVAAVAFVTPNYLSKLFRNHMGMNLREYIDQLRIEEAKRLLLSTQMSVSEVASHVGYFNISYFSTVFHKIVGMSPVDWRNDSARGE